MDKSPDSTSLLGNVNLEPGSSNCEVVDISSEDDLDNSEIIELSSDEEADNNEIIDIKLDDKKDTHEKVKITLKSEPDDEIYNLKIVKVNSENVNSMVSQASECFGNKQNLAEEEKVTDLKKIRNCYVDLHKSTDQSEISNCKNCTKLKSAFISSQNSNMSQMSIVKSEPDLFSSNPRLQCILCHNFYSSKLYLKYHACPADKGDDNDFNRNYSYLKQRRPYFYGKFGANFANKYKLCHLKGQKSTERMKNNEDEFRCRFCSLKFENFPDLKEHYLQVHHEKNPYYCIKCKKAFRAEIDLLRHNDEVYGTKRPYHCAKCGKTFKVKRGLRLHQTIAHAIKPYACNYCKKAFRLKNSLIVHHSSGITCTKESKLDNVEKSCFTCYQCGKTFEKSQNLLYHLEIHSDVRPYVCKKCGKDFKQFAILCNHRKVHGNERPFPCNVCGKRFKYKKDFVRHKIVHNEEKPYVCDVCRKSFKWKKSLDIHKIVHSEERPYVCNVCRQCFKRNRSLKLHKAVHSDERPYVCKICEKDFKRLTALRRHKKNVHDETP